MTTRRGFLGQAGAMAFVYGLPLPALARADDPSWLAGALEKMAAANKRGIVLRIPAGKELRHKAGHLLMMLQNSADKNDRELLCEAVFLCLEPAAVAQRLQGGRETHDLLLVDARGKVIDGVPFDWSRSDVFGATLRRLLHGKDDSRLKEQAEGLRNKAPAEVLKALETPDAEALEKLAPSWAPLLVHERMKAAGTDREKVLRESLEKYFLSVPVTQAGPRLPYGLEARPRVGGCGDDCEESPREAVECGMARVSPGYRSFVKYLTR